MPPAGWQVSRQVCAVPCPSSTWTTSRSAEAAADGAAAATTSATVSAATIAPRGTCRTYLAVTVLLYAEASEEPNEFVAVTVNR